MRYDSPKPSAQQTGVQFQRTGHFKVAVHTQFYQWVSPLAQSRTVLDAGCGGAFGAALLARVAGRVIAVDNDLSLMQEVCQLYGSSSLALTATDCEQLALADRSCDLVVASALFEYLHNPTAFLLEASRVLKPGGFFLCATKNCATSLLARDGTPLYKNHRQEFTAQALGNLLQGVFAEVQLYGQSIKPKAKRFMMHPRARAIEHLLVRLDIKRHIPSSWRKRARSAITGVDQGTISPDDFEITQMALDEAWYLVGRGTKP